MKAKYIYNEVVSFTANCINSCISLLKVLVRSSFALKLPPTGPSSDCIVLGNGPSLALSFQKHPEFFRKHPLICVNSFSLTAEYTELKPQYYVLLDPNFWLAKSESVKQTIKAMKERTSWNIYLLVPPTAKNAVYLQQLIRENPYIKPCYFNYTVFNGFDSLGYRLYRQNLAMPQCQNVLVASLFLSVNLGFKNIYLFGADHTWHQELHVTDENVLCFKNIHFYENAEQVRYVPFYKGEHTKETFRMDEIFVTLGKSFYGYIAVNKYADHRKATIYNASEISFIDAFKRIKL